MLAFSFGIVDVHLVSLTILAFLLPSLRQSRGDSATAHFRTMVLIVASLIVLEALGWVVDGQPGPSARVTTWIVHSLLLALVISNPWTGWYFSIDATNTYARGPLFLLLNALSYSYLLYTFARLIINRRRLRTKELVYLVLFLVFPLVGGALQVLIYGTALLWPGYTLAILMIFLKVQERKLGTDYLTGLENRGRFDQELQTRILRAQSGRTGFVAFMFDLDGFKAINDTYGHSQGDAALEVFAQILRASFRSGDLVARYAGDEFMALVDEHEGFDPRAMIERLRHNLASYTTKVKSSYRLTCSVGYLYYAPGSNQKSEDFLHDLDAAMYANKAANKALQTQK